MYMKLVYLYVCVVVVCLPSCAWSDEERVYTNSWAVEIEGGYEVAEEVAKRHDFVNLGQV